MTQSSHLLRQILNKIEELRAQGQKCLAVFDLDSTLFDVSPRLLQILLDFAADPAHQKKFPNQVRLFEGIRTERTDWGIRNALERAGLDGHPSEFQIAIHDYWQARFFANEYLQYDLPYDGAVDFVHQVVNTGADVVYLTGRDVARMGPGSAATMKHWGFPLDNTQTQLILKPHKDLDDAEFKTNWFAALPNGKYSQTWFFENEPVNIHHLRKQLPDVNVIFFDSTHAGKAKAPTDLPAIMHFLMGDE
jgi:hypothetical protein